MGKLESILTNDFSKCYLCGSTNWIEIHHIFGGALRKKSEKFKLLVPLCHYCHNEPPNGVHFNKQRDFYLKKVAQIKFEKIYDVEFLKEFGKNYKD